MSNNKTIQNKLLDSIEMKPELLEHNHIAHLTIHHNQVVGVNLIPGLEAETEEIENGIKIDLLIKEGTIIENPVQMCFGMLPETGIQQIVMNVRIEDNARISVIAHCSFPNAVDIIHKMDAQINVGQNSTYTYYERHIHGEHGGIKVIPKAKVILENGAKFKTEFELLKGRVGLIDIDYETICKENSILEMDARINGTGDDIIKIRETGMLEGENARGVLKSRIAVRDKANAEVYNKLSASAPYARGHVDCKEIIQDEGVCSAIPIVEVSHPKAHITHEASIGSVDSKQLDTLMSRGLSEDDAVELIIQGLLS